MKIKDIVYHYDRIRINSEITIEDLKELLPVKKLQKNCNNSKNQLPVICKPSPWAQDQGYQSTIDAYQPNTLFLETLKKYDLGKHGIGRIEIAKDFGFKNKKDLLKFQKHYIKHTIRLYSKDSAYFIYVKDKEYINYLLDIGHLKKDEIPEGSFYLGKKFRKNSNNYLIAYIPPKPKTNQKYSFHTEFVSKNKTNTNRTLKIHSIYKLKSAEEHYVDLQSRFLRQGILDTKKINRLLKLGEIEPRDFEGIVEFADFIIEERHNVFKKRQHYELNKSMMIRNNTFKKKKKKKLEKEYRLDRYDKKIINLKIKDYIKYSIIP